ncbi:MAG: 5-deoxy-glucuronate isomerase [Anaerolineae bacterium]|nr:5-deoxy-glucuronate isomerase [Anaerolineae bacterium]
MTPYTSHLLVQPDFSKPAYLTVTPESAEWEHLSFQAVQLKIGEQWAFDTNANELVLVILGGTLDIHSNRGEWFGIGSRRDVFSGMPTCLFLSQHTSFTVTCVSAQADFACGWAKSANVYPPRLVTPEEVEIELRGGGNVSRQINRMVPPGFPCDRLVAVEVYTPSGNWSSYPPHKHDHRIMDATGTLLEADLEEVYFYKINPQDGFAYQRIYTDDRNLDELILVHDSHLVLSPEGYHPVVSAPGYTTYYLNFLAGSDQSLTATDDPDHAWVKTTWGALDPRVPVVSLAQNTKNGA